MAGPLFDGDKSWIRFLRSIPYGATKDSAKFTIAIYTNPGGMGSDRFDSAHLNLVINREHNYQQPGVKFIGLLGRTFYNHAFSVMLMAALCGQIRFLVDGIDLNFLFRDVGEFQGTHHATITRCFPFFCPERPNGY